MMSDLQETTLEAVCQSIDYGFTASAQDKPSDYRFLRITDIVSNQINWSSVPYVSVDPGEAEKYLLNDDDIVIARTGATTGYSAYIQNAPKTVFASYLVRYKVKPEYNARYISYCLKSAQWWSYIRGVLGDKSAQPNASASTMAKFRFKELPRKDQDAIAQILGDIDDKIVLNQRMNETLEAMARALFKSWFVDFDPVRAKAEGRKPVGMDAATAALFPATFNDDGLPEGWKQGTLGKIADSAGVTVQPNQTSPDTPYIGLEHMPRRCIALSEWAGAGKVTSNKFAFLRGDFLFGKLRPYFHKVGVAAIDGISSTDILIVRPKSEEFYAFVLSVISGDEFVGYTDQTSRGTKMPRTNWKDMAAYEITLPDSKIALAYNAIVKPMLEQVIANVHECRTLAELRDTLLPKLISGELRIDEEQEKIKEAVR